MAVTVQMINNKARFIMQDEGDEGVRWLNEEVIGWVNSGLKEVVILKPNSLVNNEPFQITAGNTKQTLPSSEGKQALMLLDVPRNLGADGVTPGLPILPIARRILDLTLRTWHIVDPTQTAVKHFTYDNNDPKTFYIYPPLVTAAYIEIVYSREPLTVSTLADTVDISDIYESCLVDYVLYRAYSKDSDLSGKMERAAGHYKSFINALGGKQQAENSSAGGSAAKPGAPQGQGQ
jgi:hypothetical protein